MIEERWRERVRLYASEGAPLLSYPCHLSASGLISDCLNISHPFFCSASYQKTVPHKLLCNASEFFWIQGKFYFVNLPLSLISSVSFLLSFKNSFYWNIVALQCCINFFGTAKWFSHACTHTHFFLIFFFTMVYNRVLNRVPCAI